MGINPMNEDRLDPTIPAIHTWNVNVDGRRAFHRAGDADPSLPRANDDVVIRGDRSSSQPQVFAGSAGDDVMFGDLAGPGKIPNKIVHEGATSKIDKMPNTAGRDRPLHPLVCQHKLVLPPHTRHQDDFAANGGSRLLRGHHEFAAIPGKDGPGNFAVVSARLICRRQDGRTGRGVGGRRNTTVGCQDHDKKHPGSEAESPPNAVVNPFPHGYCYGMAGLPNPVNALLNLRGPSHKGHKARASLTKATVAEQVDPSWQRSKVHPLGRIVPSPSQ